MFKLKVNKLKILIQAVASKIDPSCNRSLNPISDSKPATTFTKEANYYYI